MQSWCFSFVQHLWLFLVSKSESHLKMLSGWPQQPADVFYYHCIYLLIFFFQGDCSQPLWCVLGEAAWTNHLSAWCYSSASSGPDHSLHPARTCERHRNLWPWMWRRVTHSLSSSCSSSLMAVVDPSRVCWTLQAVTPEEILSASSCQWPQRKTTRFDLLSPVSWSIRSFNPVDMFQSL